VKAYDHLIEDAARRYSIDPDIVRAIIYTEASRGSFYGKDAQALGLAKTHHPGNISPSWQPMIPGSRVENPRDNIELATLLISRIASGLDDPSIENIYSLYNSLSHDRTYVNKETKSTPYFVKLAMEVKAWEKKDWLAPELPTVEQVPHVGGWGLSPLVISPNPVLRELRKYKTSMAPDAPEVSTAASDLGTPAPQLQPNAAFGNPVQQPRYSGRSLAGMPTSMADEGALTAPDHQNSLYRGASNAHTMPVRYLSRRIAGRSDASSFEAGVPAEPLVQSDEIFFPGRPASFDDRFGNWIASPPIAPARSPYQSEPPQATRLPGLVSGEPMPSYPVLPPIFGFPETGAPRDDDWLLQLLAPRGRR